MFRLLLLISGRKLLLLVMPISNSFFLEDVYYYFCLLGLEVWLWLRFFLESVLLLLFLLLGMLFKLERMPFLESVLELIESSFGECITFFFFEYDRTNCGIFGSVLYSKFFPWLLVGVFYI
jgi:hypothetical protein